MRKTFKAFDSNKLDSGYFRFGAENVPHCSRYLAFCCGGMEEVTGVSHSEIARAKGICLTTQDPKRKGWRKFMCHTGLSSMSVNSEDKNYLLSITRTAIEEDLLGKKGSSPLCFSSLDEIGILNIL